MRTPDTASPSWNSRAASFNVDQREAPVVLVHAGMEDPADFETPHSRHDVPPAS